jgi:hypothetical protein
MSLLEIIPIVDEIVSLIPNKNKALALKTQLISTINAQQAEINQEEAKNPNTFISGWRPALGWCLVGSTVYHLIVVPLIVFGFSLFGKEVHPPMFDFTVIIKLLVGMLGLNGV